MHQVFLLHSSALDLFRPSIFVIIFCWELKAKLVTNLLPIENPTYLAKPNFLDSWAPLSIEVAMMEKQGTY